MRLYPADTIRVGAAGLRTRPLRVVLSALGIAIGIAAMVSVVGISTSSRADLDRILARLGTNLLTVAPGVPIFSAEPARLPTEAVTMIARIGPVTSVTAVGDIPEARVYRNDHVPSGQTGAIAVLAARLNLSVRTVAYALEDVMDRYGARTRFQLGLLLGAQIDENRQHT